jgi:hypothetical protein
MKKIWLPLFVFITVVTISTALASDPNNQYVSNQTDPAEDGSVDHPWNAISEGLAEVNDGGNVWLVSSTYTTTNISPDSHLLLNTARGNISKNVTIDVNGIANAAITVATSRAIRFDEDNTGYTITFKNCTFSNPTTSYILWDADSGGNITFENCTFSSDDKVTDAVAKTGSPVRNLTLTDCTLTAFSITAQPFDLAEIDYCKLDGCTITDAYTTDAPFLYTGGSVYLDLFVEDCNVDVKRDFLHPSVAKYENISFAGNTIVHSAIADATEDSTILLTNQDVRVLSILNNTFSCTATAKVYKPIRLDSHTQGLWMPIIGGNTLTFSRSNYYGTAITLGPEVYGASIFDNIITNFRIGIEIWSDYNFVFGNVVRAINPLATYGMMYSNVYNNTLVSVDGYEDGRAMVLGRDNITAESSPEPNTSFDDNTFTDASAWDLSGVTVGIIAERRTIAQVADAATDLDPNYYGIVNAVDDTNNSITVDEWINTRTGVVEDVVTGTWYVTVTTGGGKNVVFNNILDGSRAHYTVTFDFNPCADEDYFDYNCYRAGSSCLSNLGIVRLAAVDSLAELQARWAVWEAIHTSNDEHSVEGDPLFTDFDNDDYTLANGSPCLQTGKTTIGVGQLNIGAWQSTGGGGGQAVLGGGVVR